MSNPADRVRAVDRIDTGPRFTEADAIRLNRLMRGTDTLEMLTSLLKSGMAGDVAVVSSFGAESAVLLHLVSRVDPAIPRELSDPDALWRIAQQDKKARSGRVPMVVPCALGVRTTVELSLDALRRALR